MVFQCMECIDGYSSKVLWLKVCRTNNDPVVTGNHFLNAVREYGGCPTILRTDNGTENVIMAAMQSYFRCNGDDEYTGVKSTQIWYITIKSTY